MAEESRWRRPWPWQMNDAAGKSRIIATGASQGTDEFSVRVRVGGGVPPKWQMNEYVPRLSFTCAFVPH